MNRFTHFELATEDIEKTAAFLRNVFGWEVQKWEGPIDYWMVSSGDESTAGINGGLMEADDTFRGTINTVEVEDIDAALAKVQANGGEVISPKQPIPGVGYQAYFKDTGGLLIGLHQPDPEAGAS